MSIPPETFLLVSGDFVRTGGMDMGNYFFADFLARKGCDVHIVSHNVESGLSCFPNVTWHRVPRPYHSTILGEPILRLAGRRVAKQIKRQNPSARFLVNGGNCPLPDINWVHYVHAAYQAHSDHGLRAARLRVTNLWYRYEEADAFRKARVIIANSERTKADLIKYYGLDPSKVRTVYYGIDPETFCPATPGEKAEARRRLGISPERFVFLFVGALGDRRKGFDTLFESWTLIGPEMRNSVRLLVVGTGAELSLWKTRAMKSGYADSIQFLGFRRDVPAILKAADVLLSPTRYETFGLGVLEAVCCGLPVVVSRDAGVAEHFPRQFEPLLLEDPNDAATLAIKMRMLLQTHAEWASRMQTLSGTLRNYRWDDMSRSLLAAVA